MNYPGEKIKTTNTNLRSVKIHHYCTEVSWPPSAGIQTFFFNWRTLKHSQLLLNKDESFQFFFLIPLTLFKASTHLIPGNFLYRISHN